MSVFSFYIIRSTLQRREFCIHSCVTLYEETRAERALLRFSTKQNRSTERCSKLKRSVDMTSSGKNGLNIRTNASPKWDRTRCPEE